MSSFYDDPLRPGPSSWDDERAWDDDDRAWDDGLPDQAPPLALPLDQRQALAAAIDEGLRQRGCDNTLRAARKWAAGAGVSWRWLRARLEDNGGYCDCEVVLNVIDADAVGRG